jgi:glycosyltransferase involved in cell wall biosynthesis
MILRVEQAPRTPPFEHMDRVGVVLPAYNEERHLEQVVRAALGVGIGHVVVVNDCSTDSTPEILDRLARDERVEALHHGVNQGKQAAVKHGLQVIVNRSDISAVAVLDADMQTDPALLAGLCRHVGAYDIVIGRRSQVEMPFIRRLANALANAPYQILAGLPVHDIQSGFRLYTREVAAYLAEHLPETGRYSLEHTAILLVGRLAAERGREYRIAEVEVPCPYGRAESSIRLRDNLQLTRVSLAYAYRLSRLRRGGPA